jgi:repressor LexA
MTDRGFEILTEIHAAVKRDGFPPSVRELCDLLGLASPSTVHMHLAGLEREGLIERRPGQPRALTITTLGLSALLARSLAA